MEAIINYIIGILGLILAVVGIYLTIRSKRIKEPVYSVKSINVISSYSSTYDNLTIAYKGEKVENFTMSKVLFYNNGTETIDREDIVKRNKRNMLRISGLECEILDARILQANNPSNDFRVSLDKANSSVIIDFEYLDQNQGAVMEIIHTGLVSENISLSGDIKGVEKIVYVDHEELVTKVTLKDAREIIVVWLMVTVSLVLLYLSFFDNDTLELWLDSALPLMDLLMTFVIGGGAVGTVMLFIALVIAAFRMFYPVYRLPVGLESFND